MMNLFARAFLHVKDCYKIRQVVEFMGETHKEEIACMSMGKKLSSRKECLLICAFVAGLMAIVCCVCPPYYSMNDDVMMKSILSGTYAGVPDGHAVYMKYPLTGLISLLYRIAGNIPWFDLMLVGCFWLTISAVLCRVVKLGRECQSGRMKYIVLAVFVLLCTTVFLPHLLTLHYTLVAAMVGGCGLFLMMTGEGPVSLLLLLLCYCIRSQVFFLLLPFLAVAVLWHLLMQWREKRECKAMLVRLSGLVAAVAVCMLWDGLMYRNGDWQQYQEYNDSRTRLYDYEYLAPYEENQAAFEEANISKAQYDILEQYVLVLDRGIDAETMEKASDITADLVDGQSTLAERVKDSIREYYYHFRYTDTPYKYLVVCGYLFLLIILWCKRQLLPSLLVCCMAGGRSLIWVYLIWKGRFPERIYASLYFIELMILAGMLLDALWCAKEERTKAAKAGAWSVAVVVSVLCLCVGVHQWTEMYDRTMVNRQEQLAWDAMTEYCEAHPEELFFLDVTSMVSYSGKVFDNETTQENYLLAGGWMSESPLLKGRLEDASDGAELLCRNGEQYKYIVAANRATDWLQEYCESRFQEVEIQKIDTILVNDEEFFYVMRIK